MVAAQTMQEHKDAGHLNYRKDCADCLAGTGRTKPHRRNHHPEANVLSIDLAGPLRKGINKERYFLAASFTVVESTTKESEGPFSIEDVPDQEEPGMEDPFLILEQSDDESPEVEAPPPFDGGQLEEAGDQQAQEEPVAPVPLVPEPAPKVRVLRWESR